MSEETRITYKEWECCEVCNRMYRSGETYVDCPGFAEPVNTYLQRPETQAVCPCSAWLLERKADNVPKVCEECFKLPAWRVFPVREHYTSCTTPGCEGSGIITPVEEDRSEL